MLMMNPNFDILLLFFMSINFIVKKEGLCDSIAFPGTEMAAHLLHKLIAEKLKIKENDFSLVDANSGIKIVGNDSIKYNSTVLVEKATWAELRPCMGIVSNE
jgi:hypothetical protein